jgi:hypothetical protein
MGVVTAGSLLVVLLAFSLADLLEIPDQLRKAEEAIRNESARPACGFRTEPRFHLYIRAFR